MEKNNHLIILLVWDPGATIMMEHLLEPLMNNYIAPDK